MSTCVDQQPLTFFRAGCLWLAYVSSAPALNGQHLEPGGWNRVVLEVIDLSAGITALKNADVHGRTVTFSVQLLLAGTD
jgi:hypothetical protein